MKANPFPPGTLLVTGNPGKIEEARRICGFALEAHQVDLPEIQSLDIREILRGKAKEAWRVVQRPVIVEETSLELKALNGFPGPLVKWMLSSVGAEGIARTAHELEDGTAHARCLLLLFDGEEEIFGEGITPGTLVLPARGEGGFGWDPVFQPDGSTHTYAEMEAAEKSRLSHRGAAWRDLLSRFPEDN